MNPIAPSLVAATLLLISLGEWPYAYYQFLRLVVTSVAAFNAYVGQNTPVWMWVFISVAFLFNPLIPFYMKRETWAVLDVATAGLFLGWIAARWAKARQQ